MKTYVYLDWNIYNKIEKVDSLPESERLVYNRIREQILGDYIVTPYSNAHINDLARGYKKDNRFVQGHIENISHLSKNLCLTQYWNENRVTWHFRDPLEFLQTTVKDSENNTTLEGFLSEDETGLSRIPFMPLKYNKLPEDFAQLFEGNSLFDIMYPKTKVSMTYYSFAEDMFDFVHNIKKDFALYKQFRKLINDNRKKLPQSKSLFDGIDKSITSIPSQLKFDNIWEKYKASQTFKNSRFQLIIDTYYKLDLGGYMQDEKFENLIDDSLHVYYGAQCDFFVTNDDRCFAKATKVFEDLQIKTKVLKPLDCPQSFA
ncbi:MAG: hypothetical protein EOO88_09010 [Pedobacter sp.]|nr:MAG: hypothetical protein EOO88_09010 [Pedobacter sp.]